MNWECSECGEISKRQHRPSVCPSCGLAGVIFTAAEPDPESETIGGGLRGAWFRAGFERPPHRDQVEP